MTKPPAFQFYVKDWLTGTRLLSFAAKGAYIDLLAWSWDNGPLPLKIRDIAKTIGAIASEFSRLWKQLSRHWERIDSGYINQRLERERRKQKSFRKLQAAKGRASAEARINRGSTEGQPGTQPKGNQLSSTGGQPSSSSALALSSSEDQERTDQDQRADARPSHAVLERLAHDVLREQSSTLPIGQLADYLKDKAASAHVAYHGRAVTKAIESAMAQRARVES